MHKSVAINCLAALTLALTLPLAAQAHRAWLLPAATVLSSDTPWVTFDAAVSNDIFHTDYVPLRIDNLRILTPAGAQAAPENVGVGKHRTTFDLQLVERGTYKLYAASQGLFASWTEGGEQRRWRGNRTDFEREVPAGAEDLRLTESTRRLETFVTAGTPTDTVFAPSNRGLELVPVTHPNDLFAGETARFRFLIDGEPAAGLQVEAIPGGMRYRNRQQVLSAVTDASGEAGLTWPAAGMYWLSAEYEDDRASVANAKRRASYSLTLEVLPQ